MMMKQACTISKAVTTTLLQADLLTQMSIAILIPTFSEQICSPIATMIQ